MQLRMVGLGRMDANMAGRPLKSGYQCAVFDTNFAGRISESGEGRWAIKAAIDGAVPAHVLMAALYERFSSRREADFGDKLLSAMPYQFGGQIEKKQPH